MCCITRNLAGTVGNAEGFVDSNIIELPIIISLVQAFSVTLLNIINFLTMKCPISYHNKTCIIRMAYSQSHILSKNTWCHTSHLTVVFVESCVDVY